MISDLQTEKEILPLFDFTCNEFSRDVLIELFSEMPGSVNEILTRQQIIKALANNKALHITAPYYKSELNEVYAYLESLKSQGNGSTPKFHLFFTRTERSKEAGRLSQLIIFFHKIYQSYFASLDENHFPFSFGEKIKNIKRFLSDLDVLKYQATIKKRAMSISEITGLSAFLKSKIKNAEMDGLLKDLFLFEAYLSIARGMLKHAFAFPSFHGQGILITGFYHPLLKHPIKNNLNIREPVTLITGPNMSGKSTLLKAIGICVVLAHLGFPVPAEKCELPFFDNIAISLHLNDDLQNGFSRFMTEIKFLKDVVVAAGNGKKCFAVFDELFSGTNAEDALVISKTTVAGLAKFSGSHFFISTHLQQLKETISFHSNIRSQFIECILENNKPVFSYTLREGWSDLKIGQLLFEQEGLNRLLE